MDGRRGGGWLAEVVVVVVVVAVVVVVVVQFGFAGRTPGTAKLGPLSFP